MASGVMRAALHTGGCRLDVRTVPAPQVTDPDHVLVRVAWVGFCGSDKHDLDHPPRMVQIPGHEFSGVVEETGPEVEGFSRGDRVAVRPRARCGRCPDCLARPRRRCLAGGVYGCRGNGQPPGAMAEYVLVRAENLTRVPDDVTLQEAALADPLAVAVHSIDCGPDVRGRDCVVLGAGVIGILLAQVLRLRRAREIVMVDIRESHLEQAKALVDCRCLPADDRQAATEALARLDCGIFYELAGGDAPTLDMAIDAAAEGGWVLLVSQRPGGAFINYQRVLFRQLTLRGVASVSDEAWEEALRLIFTRSIRLLPLVTHVFPLEDATPALMTALEGEALKVMLRPHGDID